MPRIPTTNLIRPDAGIFLGIDPGVSGGMVSLLADSRRLGCSFKFVGSTDHQVAAWLEARRRYIVRAAIEKVNAMPGQGVVAMFTFGKSYGFLRGILTALKVPFVEVQPKVWQGRLGIPPRKKDEPKPKFKKRLIAEAHKRWPDRINDIVKETADASLIADWLRLEEVGRA